MAVPDLVEKQTEPVRLKMSYEEFLRWSDEDTHAEWVDGEVIVFMPPKLVHQITRNFLNRFLSLFVELFDLGQLLVAPLEMKPTPTANSREPDILFIAQEHLHRLTEDRLAGPADLIVEIISDDSVRRDRDDKYKEYRDVGVREYWIVDPRPGKHRADFYRLDKQGEYQLFATEENEKVASEVLSGFWLKPKWLWPPLTISAEMAFCEVRGLTAGQIEHIQQLLRGEDAPGDEE
ncbi:MAG TPA: Uma2 family endonuclease [Anaerolineae bacterium]